MREAHEMKKAENYPVRRGTPLRMGVSRNRRGVNFSLNVKGNEKVEVLLYHPGEPEPFQIVEMLDQNKTGLVDAVHVSLPRDFKFEYTYRVNGVETPDPFARVLHRYPGKGKEEAIRCSVDPEYTVETEPLEHLYRDTVCYKIHVKGFTSGKGSGVRHPGTFTGVREKIPYLKKLGVTSLIVMPPYEFFEKPQNMPASGSKYPEPAAAGPDVQYSVMNIGKEEQKANFWGYTDG